MPDDASVLAAIYRRHAPSVFRRARRLLGNDADAHEISTLGERRELAPMAGCVYDRLHLVKEAP